MSYKDSAHVVTPDNIHLDQDGTLHYYFSDALDGEDQDALRSWGHDLVGTGAAEANVSIVVDLPTMVHDLLAIGFGSEKEGGGYLVESEHRPRFDALKQQLERTLALINAVTYEGAPPVVANPEECNQDVFKDGTSLGFFDFTKQEAETYCVEQTQKTGHLHDWHYVGGRVHVKAMLTTK